MYNNIVSKILIFFVMVLPYSYIHAQTDIVETVPAPQNDIPASETVATDQSVIVPAPAPQDTVPASTLTPAEQPDVTNENSPDTQSTISADTLIQTQDPNLVPADSGAPSEILDPVDSTGGVIIENATSTNATNTTPIIQDTNQNDNPPDDTVIDVPPPVEPVADIPTEDIAPKKTFTFVIGKKALATEKDQAWKTRDTNKSKNSQKITEVPSVSVDPSLEVPVVSGLCSNKYFVILLYANETDYSNHPSASILNNAYPCVNGHYSYTMSDVPHAIPNGTYYLMVGEMGDTGSWTPITSQLPIDISR